MMNDFPVTFDSGELQGNHIKTSDLFGNDANFLEKLASQKEIV